VKHTANAEIPAYAGMTKERFSQLFDNVNPASSFVCSLDSPVSAFALS
jgi:hypothetical protein